MQKIEPKLRVVAGVICIGGLYALGTQIQLSMSLLGSGPLTALWVLIEYFTILTNILMTATFAVIAVLGRRMPYGWMTLLTLSMIMVGAIYHALLADLRVMAGVAWWVDQTFHTLMPVAMLWFWLTEVTRHNPRNGRPVLWLIWPMAFVVYALVRGTFTGSYPYPFLDVGVLGWFRIGGNVAAMTAIFAALAFALHALGQIMPLRR